MVGTGEGMPEGGGPPFQRVRPSRSWYWAAAGALVLGVGWIVLGLLWVVSGRIDSFQRVPIPGEREIALSEPGNYLIYYEGPGAGQGVVLSGFDYTLTPTDGKDLVRPSPYGGSLTYSVGGHAGVAVLSFHIDEPRTLELRLSDGAGGAPAQVAVGSSLGPLIVGTVVGGLAWFLAGFVIALVVFLRRRRARRALRSGP